MSIPLILATIAIATSIAVVLLWERLRALTSKKQRAVSISSECLNPLRLYTEESFFRLYEIDERFRQGQKENLLFLKDVHAPEKISQKAESWFNDIDSIHNKTT